MPGRKPFFAFLSAVFSLLLSIPLQPLNAADSLPDPLNGIHEEVKVDLVNVYLTATDSNGAFVSDLRPEDLILKEDGVPQGITNFDHSSSAADPITVVILIDTSLSMNEEYQSMRKLEMAKKGALLLIGQLQQKDRMLLIRVSDAATDRTGMVSERTRMKEAVRSIKSDNGLTALLDGIALATDKLKNQRGQKLIFICSDGEDTASRVTPEEVLQKLKNSPDVSIIALGINAFKADNDASGQHLRDGKTLLQSLADSTGGYAFFPADLKDLDRVMDNLKFLVSGAYSIGYHPSNSTQTGHWRKIEITSSRPGVKLKYRSGYYSR